MASSSTPTRVARLPLRVALKWSIALSVMATVFLIAVLSVRMAQGRDPALGPKLADRPQASTHVVTIPVPSPPEPAVAPPATAPAPPPAPVQTTTS